MQPSITTLLSSLFTIEGCLVSFFITFFIEIPVINANSKDLEQMPHSAAFELCLHCLPSTLLGISD